jgi:hypothetical protein
LELLIERQAPTTDRHSFSRRNIAGPSRSASFFGEAAVTVLVLGSKPGSVMPLIEPCRIYTANGAAARAIPYLDRHACPLTCVAGGKAIALPFNWRAVSEARPARIVLRRGRADVVERLQEALPDSTIDVFTTKQQWLFQQMLIGRTTLWVGEAQYETQLARKIIRTMNYVLRRRYPLGVSTGLLATLIALHENPEVDVLLAGIGIETGGHFYENTREHGNRANVDSWIFPRLPKSISERLVTTDRKLAALSSLRLWSGSALEIGKL